MGLWNESIRTEIKMANGSIQNIDELPAELKKIYRTPWRLPIRSVIDMAAGRAHSLISLSL